MLTSVEGVYRKGRVELREQPGNVPDEARVIVTFLGPAAIDLRGRGIDERQASELRARMATFAECCRSRENALSWTAGRGGSQRSVPVCALPVGTGMDLRVVNAGEGQL